MGRNFINALTARPSETSQMNQTAKTPPALGFRGVRIDVSFESIFVAPTDTGDFSGFDNAITQYVNRGIEHFWITLSPFPSVSNAGWTALIGTYASAARPAKKRPPAGTGNAGWIAIADQLNLFEVHTAALFESLGIPITNLKKQIVQEPAIGLADSPRETTGTYPALTDAEAAGYTGVWDTDATWDAIAVASGKAAYADVRGLHEFLEFIYPRIDSNGSIWAMPSIGGEVAASIEVPTIFRNGYSWWQSIEAANEDYNGGDLELCAHIYPGDFKRRAVSPERYARFARKKLISIMTAVRAARPSTAGLVWNIPEFGATADWIFGILLNTNGEYTEQALGRFWAAMFRYLGAVGGVDVLAIEELAKDPTTLSGNYWLIDTPNNTIRGAAKWLALANGVRVDASGTHPSWDASLTWTKPANEVIEPL